MAKNNTLSNNQTVSEFLKTIMQEDPQTFAQMWRTVQAMAMSASPEDKNNNARTDWEKITHNISLDETLQIAKVLESAKNGTLNEEVKNGVGYEGWDSTGSTHKVKRIVTRPKTKIAQSVQEAEENGVEVGDEYIVTKIAETEKEAKEHGVEVGQPYEVQEEIEVEEDETTPPGTYEQMYGKPLLNKGTKTVLTDVAAPLLSNAAHTAGNAFGDYRSILGDAMLAMANNNYMKARTVPINRVTPGAAERYYMNAAADNLNEAYRLKAGGAVAKDIGTGTDKTIREIAANSKARDDAARQAQLMINEHPVSDYWRETASIRRNAREMAKENRQ